MTCAVSVSASGAESIADHVDRWQREDRLARMWRKDPTVWADPPVPEIGNRLGWLDAPESSRSLIPQIVDLHKDAVAGGITDIILCGMGGSSLAPEVFAAALPVPAGAPVLTVMDSTHPDAVRTVTASIDPATTWFIIASKSGGTIETMSFLEHFWSLTVDAVPDPGSHFIAITDPGTSLEELAAERGFRDAVLADPNVGGRYSALTAFGLVPAGLLGMDLPALLDAAAQGASLCREGLSVRANPGFTVGSLLAERALSGVDKAQFIGTHPVETIGIWIEQLVAESTGKHGVGIVPIDDGPVLAGSPGASVVRLGSEPSGDADVTFVLEDPYDIGAVMFIMEFATAVAGELLAINPFDQPDVQLAKKLANEAMAERSSSEAAASQTVTDQRWIDQLVEDVGHASPSYVSIQAYIEQTPIAAELLDELRRDLSDLLGVYVTIGYGPRFLHSTGQLHKGGPAGGVFLQITDNTGLTLEVPDAGYSFNELIAAQAQGDRAALAERDRTVIAVQLDGDTPEALRHLTSKITRSLRT